MYTRPDAPPVMVVEKRIKGGEAPLAPAWPIQVLVRSKTPGVEITWTKRTSPSSATWRGVCWSSELDRFCAVGDSGRIMTSPDGNNWTKQTSPSSTSLRSVCWSSELDRFCAVGDSGKILTPPNGNTWTERTSPSSTNLCSVAGRRSWVCSAPWRAMVFW